METELRLRVTLLMCVSLNVLIFVLMATRFGFGPYEQSRFLAIFMENSTNSQLASTMFYGTMLDPGKETDKILDLTEIIIQYQMQTMRY